MANLEKLQFPALTLDGSNYLAWPLEIRANLIAQSLLHAIVVRVTLDGNVAPP